MPFTADQVQAAEVQILEVSKRIEFYVTDYSVELLALKMKSQDFVIPAYQRDDTWEAARKSRFVESLLMGLPIPFLFFWESPSTGKLEIVDGSQRLRTIHQFIHGDLQLGELERLSELSGFRFTDLLESRRRKIMNRSVRGIILSEHADEQARFDIFDRINTGSKVANKAEVRRGALVGPFLDMVIALAKDAAFGRLAPVSDKNTRLREREELITRFFAYGDGLDDYHDYVGDFLFAYARKMNAHFTDQPADVEKYRERFHSVMSFVEAVFPFGFRGAAKGTATRRARFEAIALGSLEALQARPELASARPNVANWLDSEPFHQITGSDGANAKSRLRSRIAFVREKLLEDSA